MDTKSQDSPPVVANDNPQDASPEIAPGASARPPWLIPLVVTCICAIVLGSQWVSNRYHPDVPRAAPVPIIVSPGVVAIHLPVKLPDFVLKDQDGNRVGKDDLLGHPWVADFIFTECDSVCPILNRAMVDLAKEPENVDVRFISFSVGPDDGSQTLKHYLVNYPTADESRWRILADDQETATLAVSVGLAASTDEVRDGLLPISNYLYLVDSQGIVRGTYAGRDADEIKRLRKDLAKMMGASTQPTQLQTVDTVGSR